MSWLISFGGDVVNVVVVQWNHGAAIPLFPHLPLPHLPPFCPGTLADLVSFSRRHTSKGRDLGAVKNPGNEKVSCSRLRPCEYLLVLLGQRGTTQYRVTTADDSTPVEIFLFVSWHQKATSTALVRPIRTYGNFLSRNIFNSIL